MLTIDLRPMGPSQFELGYRQGRYALAPQVTSMTAEYQAGLNEGQRRRRMQLAIEFAMLAVVVVCFAILGAHFVAQALAQRLPV